MHPERWETHLYRLSKPRHLTVLHGKMQGASSDIGWPSARRFPQASIYVLERLNKDCCTLANEHAITRNA